MTGEKPVELDYPPMPHIFQRVWAAYCDLAGDISYTHIKAYCELMQVNLTPADIKLIKDIDYIRNATFDKQSLKQILEVFNYG